MTDRLANLSHLTSLVALSRAETMAEAALSLRISQSALSKRLATLEHQLGYSLLEKQGRYSRLTPLARQLTEQVAPLLSELDDLLQPPVSPAVPRRRLLHIGIADAVMASWGAELTARVFAGGSRPAALFTPMLHSHRSATILERLHSGQYQLGICSGRVGSVRELVVEPLLSEPMALVHSAAHMTQLAQWQRQQQQRGESCELEVICIEAKSSMWHTLAPQLQRWQLKPVTHIESSVAAARMALAGFGHALVPAGVAALSGGSYQLLTGDKARADMCRPCSLVVRKSLYNDAAFLPLLQALKSHSQQQQIALFNRTPQ